MRKALWLTTASLLAAALATVAVADFLTRHANPLAGRDHITGTPCCPAADEPGGTVMTFDPTPDPAIVNDLLGDLKTISALGTEPQPGPGDDVQVRQLVLTEEDEFTFKRMPLVIVPDEEDGGATQPTAEPVAPEWVHWLVHWLYAPLSYVSGPASYWSNLEIEIDLSTTSDAAPPADGVVPADEAAQDKACLHLECSRRALAEYVAHLFCGWFECRIAESRDLVPADNSCERVGINFDACVEECFPGMYCVRFTDGSGCRQVMFVPKKGNCPAQGCDHDGPAACPGHGGQPAKAHSVFVPFPGSWELSIGTKVAACPPGKEGLEADVKVQVLPEGCFLFGFPGAVVIGGKATDKKPACGVTQTGFTEQGSGPADRPAQACDKCCPATCGGCEKMTPEQRLARQMDAVVSMEFDGKPLAEVVAELRTVGGVNIVLDMPALKQDGVAVDDPIAIKLDAVPFKTALKYTLNMAGLSYTVQDNLIVVTTPRVAAGKLVRKVYPVREFVEAEVIGASNLISILQNTVEPESWDCRGGNGHIEPFPAGMSLVITQTAEVHDQIQDLLDELLDEIDACWECLEGPGGDDVGPRIPCFGPPCPPPPPGWVPTRMIPGAPLEMIPGVPFESLDNRPPLPERRPIVELQSVTRPPGEAAMVRLVHPLQDIWGPTEPIEPLIRLIQATVEPGSWDAAGGRGTIGYFPLDCSLVVNNDRAVVEQVARFLAVLRSYRQACSPAGRGTNLVAPAGPANLIDEPPMDITPSLPWTDWLFPGTGPKTPENLPFTDADRPTDCPNLEEITEDDVVIIG
jgi:hypothetical protein